MIPTLADGTPYQHGMNIYDFGGNLKHGAYIEQNYTLMYLHAFNVAIGDGDIATYDAGWYLCRNDMEVYSGFEIPLKNYFSTKESALKASNEQHATMIRARIDELENELRMLI